MPGQFHDAPRVVDARQGRLRNDDGKVRVGQRGQHGATDPRGTVDDHIVQAARFGKLFCLLPDQGDELPRILLGDPEPRVDERPVGRIREVPLAAEVFPHLDDLDGADAGAEPAALAGEGIDDEVVVGPPDRIEPAHLGALAAGDARVRVDPRGFAAPELVRLDEARVEQEVQVRRVDVAVHHDLVLCQRGERRREDRLTRAAFAADDHDLLHSDS